MTKKAVAYINEISLNRSGDKISRDYQKQNINEYALKNDIEIVAWFEDDSESDDILSRTGVKALLDYKDAYDTVLVERSWSFSRKWGTLQKLLDTLKSKNVTLTASTVLWDCISQRSRHYFLSSKVSKKSARQVVCSFDQSNAVAKPKKLNFSFIK